MNTFVYYCICLFTAYCQTARIGSEENDNMNDSPNILPKIITIHFKTGSNFTLKCKSHRFYEENISWEFKQCNSNYKRTFCDNEDLYTLDYTEGQWKKLYYNRKMKKLEIKNATASSVGLYRCLHYEDAIIKIFMVVLKDEDTLLKDPPKIRSLVSSSNQSVVFNSSLVIQCKVTSVVPPEIRWFKDCYSTKCEKNSRFTHNGNCYCTLPAVYNYAFSQNVGVFVSKIHIQNVLSIDSGTYFCLVISVYGEDHQNITIKVDEKSQTFSDDTSFSILFLIPLIFVLVPVTLWLIFNYYYRRKKMTTLRFKPEIRTIEATKCRLIVSK